MYCKPSESRFYLKLLFLTSDFACATSRAAMMITFCLGILSSQSLHARELTPFISAMITKPTDTVKLSSDVVTIPLVGTDHNGSYECPYVQVFVNGHGPFTFLIDTGASYSLVSSKVVKAARTPIKFDRDTPDRDVVLLAKTSVGGVTLEDIWAVEDNSFDVDGILGFGAFGLNHVMFNLANREVKVSASPFDMPNSFELPYFAPWTIPIIPVGIGTATVPILIDTGDDAYGMEIRKSELGDAKIMHPPVAATNVVNGTNVQATTVTTLAQPVTLGPLQADAAVVALNDALPVGDIGYDVLRQFRIAFDPKRRVVRFQSQFDGDRFSIPGPKSLGFRFKIRDGTVTTVFAESAADRAGIKVGDTILSINGKAPSTFSPESLGLLISRNLPVRVRWSHAGTKRDAVFPIFELR